VEREEGMKRSLGPKTLAYTTPVWVIGTYDEAGRANVMTASWAGICCSRPPCVNVSLRKATYTYGCLLARRAFTVGIPSADQVREADFFGIASGRETDKVAAVGFTAVASDQVDAPYLAELPLVLECRLLHTLEIGLHTLFVGEIVDVKADEDVLDSRGQPDPETVRPFVYLPEVQRYHGLGPTLGTAFKIGRGRAG
jgi:flavin reductase (DIM6/NTAB) family NADH-FMN oxidoreductase RutF